MNANINLLFINSVIQNGDISMQLRAVDIHFVDTYSKCINDSTHNSIRCGTMYNVNVFSNVKMT